MAESIESTGSTGNIEREEVFSNAVRAGKRTYFFDVKATRRNDYYLTITESKKRYNKDGRFFYEKHKIFLYKEDFEKFIEGLMESVEFIKDSIPEEIENEQTEKELIKDSGIEETKAYTDIEFEDLEVGAVAGEEAEKK